MMWSVYCDRKEIFFIDFSTVGMICPIA